MSIIHRYLTLQFFKYFGIVQMVVICIFIVVDFISRIGSFIKSGIAFSRAFLYVFLKVPYMTVLLMPVSIILGVLIVFGLMNKNNEILALRSGGVSLSYLVKPILVIGIILTAALFLVAETVVPLTKSEANRIKQVEIKKKTILTSKEKNIWIKGKRQIIYIKYYNPAVQSIFGVTLYYFDQNFRLVRRIDAPKGVFGEGKWTFYGSIEQTLNQKSDGYDIQFRDEHFVSLDLKPENLKSVIKKSEEMSFNELLAYIRKVEEEGYDATIYKVDLHGKAAFPFVCIFMCMAGIGIAVRRSIKDKLPLAIIYGIGISFCYWIIYSFCLSLGYGGLLPPVVAAWTPNVMFGCLGGLTLLNAE